MGSCLKPAIWPSSPGGSQVAVVVDDRDLAAGAGAAARARPHWKPLGRIQQHQVHLGLAVALRDGGAEGVAAPVEQFLAHRLAAGADGAEIVGPAIARLVDLAHHLERRRRDEGDADAMPVEKREGALGIELGEAVRHHRRAVEPGREQRVEQAGDPRPFGRRPHHLVALRPVAEPLLDRRDRAQQHAMGVQRALGLAGRARGVDQERRVLGQRVDRGEAVGGRAEQAVPVEEGAAVGAGADRHDGLEMRQAIAHGQHLGQLAHVGDEGRGLGVGQAIFQRFLAEQREQRQHDGAHAIARDVADRELRTLAQEHADAVALADAPGGKRVGQPRARGQELAEGPVAHRAVGRLDDQGQRLAGMTLADGAAHVEAFGPGPAELAHRLVIGKAARDHVSDLRG